MLLKDLIGKHIKHFHKSEFVNKNWQIITDTPQEPVVSPGGEQDYRAPLWQSPAPHQHMEQAVDTEEKHGIIFFENLSTCGNKGQQRKNEQRDNGLNK